MLALAVGSWRISSQTIVDADMILVLDRGRIVERGTFAELLSAQGVFAQMWALQQEEAERSESAIAA